MKIGFATAFFWSDEESHMRTKLTEEEAVEAGRSEVYRLASSPKQRHSSISESLFAAFLSAGDILSDFCISCIKVGLCDAVHIGVSD